MVERYPRICIVRHPEVHAARGICYGHTNWVLPPEQLDSAAALLRGALPDWPIYSSPLLRCAQLAARLNDIVQVDSRLLEMHFGEWEGQRWADIPREHLDVWAANVSGYQIPGGESFDDLLQRIESFLQSLTQPSILIAHAGTIRACNMLIDGMSTQEATRLNVPHIEPVYFGT
jgi:alpha-ribazole phosphatase